MKIKLVAKYLGYGVLQFQFSYGTLAIFQKNTPVKLSQRDTLDLFTSRFSPVAKRTAPQLVDFDSLSYNLFHCFSDILESGVYITVFEIKVYSTYYTVISDQFNVLPEA